MGILYIAALIVGLGVSAVQLLLSGDGDGDGGGGDADADVDVDAEGGEGHSHGGGDGVGFAAIFLSLRFWTFGSLAFGLVGTLLTYLHLASPTTTAILAGTLGLLSGAGASWVFQALATSSTDSGGQAHDLLGQTGRVLLRVDVGMRGKIRVSVRGHTRDYLAVTDDGELQVGEAVMIESVEGDTVRVCRLPDELRLPPPSDGPPSDG